MHTSTGEKKFSAAGRGGILVAFGLKKISVALVARDSPRRSTRARIRALATRKVAIELRLGDRKLLVPSKLVRENADLVAKFATHLDEIRGSSRFDTRKKKRHDGHSNAHAVLEATDARQRHEGREEKVHDANFFSKKGRRDDRVDDVDERNDHERH